MERIRLLTVGLADRINARPKLARWLLAGPGALLAALLFMTSMPVWFPAGTAGVNNIVLPPVLAPLFWAAAFTYTCIEENLLRGTVVIVSAIVVQMLVVGAAFAG